MFGSCSEHQAQPGPDARYCSTCQRIATEGKIARRTIRAIIKAGYCVSVFDGEEITLKRSTAGRAILNAMFTTDEDYLFVYPREPKAPRLGWVFFVYGNDGWDVVSDYTTNLEEVMRPVLDYAETFDA